MERNLTTNSFKQKQVQKKIIRKKIFLISKIKKNNLKKKKEIQDYLHSNEFINPQKKSKFQQRLEDMAKQRGYNPPKK